MSVSGLARRVGFWTFDNFCGGGIRRDYEEVKKLMSSSTINEEQIREIVEHTRKNVPYYHNRNIRDISDFPVINKNILKENWQELHATNYLDKPVHLMSTSGSTGTPFTMEWDMRKRRRQLAELVYFNELAGYKLGERNVYFRVWTKQNRKSKTRQWIQNLIPIDILHLDEENLQKIRQRLKHKPYIAGCLGYASTYEYLARYIGQTDDTSSMYPMKCVISGSEVLSMESKEMLKKVFGCRVIDRYSNQENGFLAQTDDMSDEFIVNTASFAIEVLKQDSDESVKVGEVGRIVVTDLYNYVVPLIRYDTGDLAVLDKLDGQYATKLKTIQGRRVDTIYDTMGRRMTPHTLSVYMDKYEKLKQYQFIQEGKKEYTVKLNGAKGVYEDNEIQSYLKTIFGEDARIKLEHVRGIPVLSSGKFKKTVCRLEKQGMGI